MYSTLPRKVALLSGTASIKSKNFFKLGVRFKLGNGSRILFWTYWWIGEAPLRARFPRFFCIATDPDIRVIQAFLNNHWVVGFRRNLSSDDLGHWQMLMMELQPESPSQDRDSVSWCHGLWGALAFSWLIPYTKKCNKDPWWHMPKISGKSRCL
jgi:hypothetical protein